MLSESVILIDIIVISDLFKIIITSIILTMQF